MNRVAGIGNAVAAASRPKPGSAAISGHFSVAGDSAAVAATPNRPTSAVALAGMLALQEMEAGDVQDKAARRHGFALLGALGDLQKQLLAATPDADAAVIASLSRLVAGMPDAADPELAATLAAIRLRARLELLRRGADIG